MSATADEASVLVRRAARSTVATLFAAQARVHPERVAVVDGERVISYGASMSVRAGLQTCWPGAGSDRAIGSPCCRRTGPRCWSCSWRPRGWARSSPARTGAWPRPSSGTASRLVAPTATRRLVPARRRRCPGAPGAGRRRTKGQLAAASPDHLPADVDPEDPLLILYTSGTTGLPKGAVLSHRAQIVRNLVTRAEFGVAPDDTFVAWSPLYHMGAVDNSLGTLMSGGKVITVDGFDAERLAEVVADEPLGWLLLMPGMVGRFARVLAARPGVRPCAA